MSCSLHAFLWLLTALALPTAVFGDSVCAAEDDADKQARRAEQAKNDAEAFLHSRNSLRQIILAVHKHHDVNRRLPAAYSQKPDGTKLLSWRVHLLPFLGEVELYSQFHLDEPWDSDHNKKLILKMPDVYRCPAPATNA
jgi:hypothetical protein